MEKFSELKLPEQFQCYEDMMTKLLNVTSENFEDTLKFFHEIVNSKKIVCETFPHYISYAIRIRPRSSKILHNIYDDFAKRYLIVSLDSDVKSNNSSDYNQGTVCHMCETDDIEKLTKVAANPHFNFQMTDDNNTSIIDIAAMHGSVKCFVFLHKNGAKFSKNTISYALESRNQEIINILRENGHKVSIKDAIKYHYHDIVDSILEKNPNEYIPFKEALMSYNFRAVCYLYEDGIDLNEKIHESMYDHYLPLIAAIKSGSVEMVKLLLSFKADPNCLVNQEIYNFSIILIIFIRNSSLLHSTIHL